MTEHASEAVPVDFDLEAWLDGGTVTQRSVAIYARPDLMAEYEDWERRYKVAKARDEQAPDDGALGEKSELAVLTAEGERIYEEWMASKATWYVRALSPEEIDEINERAPKFDDLPEFPDPEPVTPRGATSPAATEAGRIVREDYERRKAAFLAEQEPARAELRKKRIAARDEANTEMVAAAVVKIEAANGGVVHGVTVAQLRKLRERMGQRQLQSLIDAATIATMSEPEIQPDFSRSTSKRDPA